MQSSRQWDQGEPKSTTDVIAPHRRHQATQASLQETYKMCHYRQHHTAGGIRKEENPMLKLTASKPGLIFVYIAAVVENKQKEGRKDRVRDEME